MSKNDRYEVTNLASEAQNLPDDTEVALAGRIVLWRSMGKLIFAHLQDRSGRIQFSLQKNHLDEQQFETWSKGAGMGDFVGITGKIWTTRKGERTVDVQDLVVLNKALRPMPDKWIGVTHKESQYRKRYLDLLFNEDTRKRFVMRSKAIAYIRKFLDGRDFLELETPVLQPAVAGAAAKPFVTHHNALDRDLYLRISLETYLKRAVAGSLDRVYEIGRNFRNEGIDSAHLQEFTMVEWYAGYWDYRDNMLLVRELIQGMVQEFCGDLVISNQRTKLDFSGGWQEIDYRQAVLEASGIDLKVVRSSQKLLDEIAKRGLEIELPINASYATLIDTLYKRMVRPNLIQPTFLVHHPTELVPLARRNDDDPSVLDMFQVVVNGGEIVKAYSELVDPVEQRKRLEEQVELRAAGDEETMMLEEDFIECMEYGMPPMSGLGLGVDRMVAILADVPSLRDVVLFPQMRDEASGD